MKKFDKKPLYRKVNKKTHGVHHKHGGDYRDIRRKETALGMRQGVRRGLDYTPLFKFLLSKVGNKWDVVFRDPVIKSCLLSGIAHKSNSAA